MNAEKSEEYITVRGEKYSAKLTNLILSGKNLTDEDIGELRKMSRLSALLYLDRNMISDISPLKGLSKLNEIRLDNNRIRDISPLYELKKPRYIWLGGNPIDRNDVDGLRKKFPGCAVYF